MSEKKYYVKSVISCEPYTSDADKGWLTSASNDSATWIYKKYRTAFTKPELAEIMDGAIYKVKQKSKSVTIDELIADGWNRLIGNDWEWINPLIELVPVEDEE
ncbi:hypothetical protein [Lactococcus lactis]|uniref:hypothetical protein n=1 Tax=Lactococcus lactis TaxID=1358 RepID=UPI003D0CA543